MLQGERANIARPYVSTNGFQQNEADSLARDSASRESASARESASLQAQRSSEEHETVSNATEAEMEKWVSANAHQTQLKMASVTIMKLGAMITQLAQTENSENYAQYQCELCH